MSWCHFSESDSLTFNKLKMFTERGNRKRLAIAMGYMFFGQSTGVLVLNNYGKYRSGIQTLQY